MHIPFEAWRPDLSCISNALRTAKNVYANGDTYIPVPAAEKQGSVIPGVSLDASSFELDDGTKLMIAGSTTDLHKADTDGTWTDIGGTYTVAETEGWAFAQFGDFIVATGKSTTQLYEAGSFGNLTGAPNAGCCGVVKDFMVLGDIASGRNKLHWSAINDVKGWTVGTNQSDTQEFPDGGKVQAIVSGEIGYIIQERAIRAMTYEGPPYIFRFDKVSEKRGALTRHSVAQRGNTTFLLSSDGFFAMQNGQLIPIGDGHVDEYFRNTERQEFRHKIRSAIIPMRQIVVWAYTTNNSTDGKPDRLLVYNYARNRWTIIEEGLQSVFPYTKTPLHLDNMNTVYPDLDAMTISLDSALFKGSGEELGGITNDGYLCTFSGAAMEALFETQIFRIGEQGSLVSRVRPVCDASNAEVAVRGGKGIYEMGTYSAYGTRNRDGRVSKRSRGEFQQVKLKIPADTAIPDADNNASWTECAGVDVSLIGRGPR